MCEKETHKHFSRLESLGLSLSAAQPHPAQTHLEQTQIFTKYSQKPLFLEETSHHSKHSTKVTPMFYSTKGMVLLCPGILREVSKPFPPEGLQHSEDFPLKLPLETAKSTRQFLSVRPLREAKSPLDSFVCSPSLGLPRDVQVPAACSSPQELQQQLSFVLDLPKAVALHRNYLKVIPSHANTFPFSVSYLRWVPFQLLGFHLERSSSQHNTWAGAHCSFISFPSCKSEREALGKHIRKAFAPGKWGLGI